jgi:hypothetical protein
VVYQRFASGLQQYGPERAARPKTIEMIALVGYARERRTH